LGDTDVDANPIKHRDNENRPKYNFAKLGYEDISSRFFYYKSAAWKLGDDDELVIRTEQMLADAVFLDTMAPTVTSGIGQMSEAIMVPGKNISFENPDVKINPIHLGGSISNAFNLILQKEKSISESSQDPLMQGVQGTAKTATESALLAQNAKIALGRFGNMLTNSLRNLGGLMIDVIVNHQTVADVEEIADGSVKEKFKTFILTKSSDSGLTKKIVFNPDMMGEEVDEETKSMEMLEKEGGIDSDTRIYEVNPEKWRKLKYFLFVDVEELLPLSMRPQPIQQPMGDQNLLQGQGGMAGVQSGQGRPMAQGAVQ
jgi:hypothetical protein